MRESVTTIPIRAPAEMLARFSDKEVKKLAQHSLALINFSTLDNNRATHYNTMEALEEARSKAHSDVFSLDRSIYGCVFMLDGITDFSKQVAIQTLLDEARGEGSRAILSAQQEKEMLANMTLSLPTNRMMNLYGNLRAKKVNNARTRRMILGPLLNSGAIDLWSVKYRKKVRVAIEHAIGKRRTGIIKSILLKKTRSDLENAILRDNLLKYVAADTNTEHLLECLSFVLGNDKYANKKFKIPIIKAFYDAREDFSKGTLLPMEVLEGIRGTYHKDLKQEVVLKTAKTSMTTKQKKLVQKKAEKVGVKVEFDPMKYSMIDLYIYAFENGWTKEIATALDRKAKALSEKLPFKFGSIGIIVDDSKSMYGSETQALRPIAAALATADMLRNCATESHLVTTSGRPIEYGNLIFPSGETNIAKSLIKMLKTAKDAIFILSDGYENAPAGRVAEVVEIASKIGVNTPVYHLNPVAAATDSAGLRTFGAGIQAVPLPSPDAFGNLIFKTLLETDPRRGLLALLGSVLPRLSVERSGMRWIR